MRKVFKLNFSIQKVTNYALELLLSLIKCETSVNLTIGREMTMREKTRPICRDFWAKLFFCWLFTFSEYSIRSSSKNRIFPKRLSQARCIPLNHLRICNVRLCAYRLLQWQEFRLEFGNEHFKTCKRVIFKLSKV